MAAVAKSSTYFCVLHAWGVNFHDFHNGAYEPKSEKFIFLSPQKYFVKTDCNIICPLLFTLYCKNFVKTITKCIDSPSKFTLLWKLQNFTATIFSQKFRQFNVLVDKELYYVYWFDGKKFVWKWISRFSTLLCEVLSYFPKIVCTVESWFNEKKED